MKNTKLYLRKALVWFENLKASEQLLISSCGVALFAYSIFLLWGFVDEQIRYNARLIETKKREYNELALGVDNYLKLNERRQEIQARLAASEMNFDKLGYEVDNIVKSVLKNSNYDPKATPGNTPFSGDYEKQELSLVINAITPDQLTELLFKFEKSDKPIFLSRVDISKANGGKELSARIALYIIAKTEKKA